MAGLLRVELTIPGEYRDVWLYKEAIHVWDRDGNLRYAKLEAALKYIVQVHGQSVANLVQTLVFRNDWKVGEQFVAWMRVADVAKAVLRAFGDNEEIVISLPRFLFVSSESEPYDGLVLDTHIYANRVYLATTEGLLESYINPRKLQYSYPLNQLTDFRAARVTAKYSVVNVSAEARGLHFSPIEYWDINTSPLYKNVSWRQAADFSLSTSFAWRNLLNYTQSPAPSLLRSQVEESRSEGRSYNDVSVVGYESEPTDVGALAYKAATAAAKVSASAMASEDDSRSANRFEIIGNSDNHLLVNWDNELQVIDLREVRGRDLEAKPSKTFQHGKVRASEDEVILATYPISRGFVVEFYNRLELMTILGSFKISDGESAQVRTYDNSVRHKEVIAVVREQHVSLFGFYASSHNDTDALF